MSASSQVASSVGKGFQAISTCEIGAPSRKRTIRARIEEGSRIEGSSVSEEGSRATVGEEEPRYDFNNETWKMLWIRAVTGRSSSKATAPMRWLMRKGSKNRLENLWARCDGGLPKRLELELDPIVDLKGDVLTVFVDRFLPSLLGHQEVT